MKAEDLESNEWYWHKMRNSLVFVFGLDAESLNSGLVFNSTDGEGSYFTVEAQDLEDYR